MDHIFYSGEFGLTTIEKLGEIGSDHFPMYIELTYEPEIDHAENLEDRDKENEEEVEETINE